MHEVRSFAGATWEAQVKYLQQCLHIQHDKNDTLRAQMETLKLEHHLALKALASRVEDFQSLCVKQRQQLVELREKCGQTPASNPVPTHPAYQEPTGTPGFFKALLVGCLMAGVFFGFVYFCSRYRG